MFNAKNCVQVNVIDSNFPKNFHRHTLNKFNQKIQLDDVCYHVICIFQRHLLTNHEEDPSPTK